MQTKQTRNKKPMVIKCYLTAHGKLQRGLFKGGVQALAEAIAKREGVEYDQLAKELNTDRQTIACRVAYLVAKGYAKTTKESGKIKKK